MKEDFESLELEWPSKITDVNASGTAVGWTGELDIDDEPIYEDLFFYNEGFSISSGVLARVEPPGNFDAAHPRLITEVEKIVASGYKRPVGTVIRNST